MTSAIAGPAPKPYEIQTSAATRARRVEWCLRVGAGACFIGHGAFGIITKAGWLPYFAVTGISAEMGYRLMPLIGVVDILAGVSILFSPRPIVLLYMTAWAFWTALLRPLAGESVFETFERAGNYGVPLALLVFLGRRNAVQWLRTVSMDAIRGQSGIVGRVLQSTTFALLIGHGVLGIVSKPMLVSHYATLGLPASAAPFLGYAEVAAAIAVLAVPSVALLVGVAAWKIASEMLFPLSGAPMWEFIERFGSYTAPLGLALLLGTTPFARITFPRSTQ